MTNALNLLEEVHKNYIKYMLDTGEASQEKKVFCFTQDYEGIVNRINEHKMANYTMIPAKCDNQKILFSSILSFKNNALKEIKGYRSGVNAAIRLLPSYLYTEEIRMINNTVLRLLKSLVDMNIRHLCTMAYEAAKNMDIKDSKIVSIMWKQMVDIGELLDMISKDDIIDDIDASYITIINNISYCEHMITMLLEQYMLLGGLIDGSEE